MNTITYHLDLAAKFLGYMPRPAFLLAAQHHLEEAERLEQEELAIRLELLAQVLEDEDDTELRAHFNIAKLALLGLRRGEQARFAPVNLWDSVYRNLDKALVRAFHLMRRNVAGLPDEATWRAMQRQAAERGPTEALLAHEHLHSTVRRALARHTALPIGTEVLSVQTGSRYVIEHVHNGQYGLRGVSGHCYTCPVDAIEQVPQYRVNARALTAVRCS